MSSIDTSIHNILWVNINPKKGTDYQYATVTVGCDDGGQYEFTLFPVRGKSIQITYGENDES